VDLTLDADQQATRDLLHRLLASEVDSTTVRAAESLGHSPDVWAVLAAAGIPGMGAPAAQGGGGADLPLLIVTAMEAGRFMAPVPLVEHTVGTRVVAALDPSHPRLPDLVAGDAIAAWAPVAATAGHARLVSGGAVADVVVALDGSDLVAGGGPAPQAAPRNHASAPLADRDLTGPDRRVLASGPAAADAFAAANDEWRVLTAAALAGLAAAALDLAVAYVKERHQFGVPIGSFQAIQHGLADLPGAVIGAELLVHEAAWALTTGLTAPTGATGAQLAVMAFQFAAEVARDVTARCVQYHGGYGVAEEYDAQLLYRRARGWALVAGDPADGLRHLGELLVLAGGR
jgi:alkylation response protein AidB-like acyl-CoA dehydrogenase